MAHAREGSPGALDDALAFARTCAAGAVLGNWKGRRLSPEGRDEVVQETLLRILRGIRRPEKPVKDLQDWVRGTVDLVLRERWKDTSRSSGEPEDNPLVLSPSREPSPADALLASERRARVRDCLEELPDHYRRMLLLRYREQFTNAVIAQHLGKTEKAVERAVPRALQLVRECLERKRMAP